MVPNGQSQFNVKVDLQHILPPPGSECEEIGEAGAAPPVRDLGEHEEVPHEGGHQEARGHHLPPLLPLLAPMVILFPCTWFPGTRFPGGLLGFLTSL